MCRELLRDPVLLAEVESLDARPNGRCTAQLRGGAGRLVAMAGLSLPTSQGHEVILQKDPECDPASSPLQRVVQIPHKRFKPRLG